LHQVSPALLTLAGKGWKISLSGCLDARERPANTGRLRLCIAFQCSPLRYLDLDKRAGINDISSHLLARPKEKGCKLPSEQVRYFLGA
jgi:hypothetical protein